MKRLVQSTALLFIATVAFASSRVMMKVVRLLSEAQVEADIIAMGDLLPKDAPRDLINSLSAISLGFAPNPGFTRILERTQLQSALKSKGVEATRFIIPSRVLVTRRTRELNKAEIFSAILESLQTTEGRFAEKPSPDDFTLPANLRACVPDPGLHVTRTEFDPQRQLPRFRVSAAHDTCLPPFWVWSRLPWAVRTVLARRDLAAGTVLSSEDVTIEYKAVSASMVDYFSPGETTGLQLARTVSHGEAIAKNMVVLAQMVTAGKRAVLTINTGSASITTPVVCLQSAPLGQQIRVRLAETNKILSATVSGPGMLKASD